MKMEELLSGSGNLSSAVVRGIKMSFEDRIDNMTLEEARSIMEEDFALCKNASYQNLPLCQGNYSIGQQFDEGEQGDMFEYALMVEIIVTIIFGIVVIVGVIGNALVVIVIIINKQMRSTTNYLIFSLAIADLLFTLFCVPFTASDYIFQAWPFGSIWCKVVQYLTYVTAYASVYTLLLLSIDRYFAVVHPIYAISIRTERNAIYAIVFTWTLILSSCIPLYIVHGIAEDKDNCKFRGEIYHHAAFHIGFMTTMYFIPLTVIVGLYLMILQRLWSQGAPGCTRSAESVKGKKRVTRMVIIVIVTFIICWLPIQIVLLLKSLGIYQMTTFGIFFQIFGQVLAYMNSCVNPILYAFLSDPFRKAFRKVITCGPNRKGGNSRLHYEGTLQTRPLNPRPSFPLHSVGVDGQHFTPHNRGGNNNSSTSSERKFFDDSMQRSLGANTTTSFINGSIKEDISPTNSCQSNLNGVI